ncbi:MAG: PAS domain S-box protein [Deltaproteobacteria bacterium]|nr:PAS domain S-box protein [Deltaproteobacteria bacterium]
MKPGRQHIIIAADDRSVGEELERILQEEGHEIELVPFSPPPQVVEANVVLVVPPQEGALETDTCHAVSEWNLEGKTVLAVLDPEAPWVAEMERMECTDIIRLPLSPLEVRTRVRATLQAVDLRRELTVQAADLEHLLALGRQISATLDVEEILYQLVTELAERVHVSRCSLVLVDEAKNRGLVMATSDDRQVHDLAIDLADYPELQEVIRSRNSLVIDDIASEPLLEGARGTLSEQQVGSLACYPLIVDEEILGVLVLRGDRGRASFSDRELSFAGAGAHAVAIAVRNARLIERIRYEREEESEKREEVERRLEDLRSFEDLFQHVGEGLLLVDREGVITGANPWAHTQLHFLDPLVGTRFDSIVESEADRQRLLTLPTGERSENRGEIRVPGREGGERVLSVLASALSEGATVFSLRDVTEQHRLAEELRKTGDFLENLIDSSADAIVAADVRGRIILWNDAAAQITGWTRDEAVEELHVTRIYPDEWAFEVMRQLRAPEGGGRGRIMSTRVDLLAKNGERIPVSLSAAILYEGDREIATMGIFTDLRERLKIERKLSRAQDRLVRTEQQAMIAGLAGIAAHELNQPLTSVMGYAELLRRRLAEDDPNHRAVEIIYRESERMAEIVRKIGRITRFETKTYLGDTRIVDLERSAEDEQ